MTSFGLWYDFRNPRADRPFSSFYAEVLDQIAWAEAFGREVRHRPSLLEEGVEIIRRAWSGSAEGFEGKRYRLPPVAVTPVPEQPPSLLVGAMADVAIERAARIADGFLNTQNAHHARVMAIADGPTEVHKQTLARQLLRDVVPGEPLLGSGHLPTRATAARAHVAARLEHEVATL